MVKVHSSSAQKVDHSLEKRRLKIVSCVPDMEFEEFGVEQFFHRFLKNRWFRSGGKKAKNHFSDRIRSKNSVFWWNKSKIGKVLGATPGSIRVYVSTGDHLGISGDHRGTFGDVTTDMPKSGFHHEV